MIFLSLPKYDMLPKDLWEKFIIIIKNKIILANYYQTYINASKTKVIQIEITGK